MAAAEPSQQNETALAAKLVYLLYSVADGSKLWDDKAAATSVQAQVADSTWDLDSDKALDYLKRAWETSHTIEDSNREVSRFRNSSARTAARQEVMLVARKRATELANKWLEQMTAEAGSENRSERRGAFDDRSDRSTLLLQMAMQLAPDNPAAAKDLAVESLQDGISFGFQNVLVAIQTQDFNLATSAFWAALSRLRMLGMADPNELLILYSYLYTPGKVMSANSTSNAASSQIAVSRNSIVITSAAQLDPALAREFLKLAAELLAKASPQPATLADPQLAARLQISVISVLLGNIEKEFPDQGAYLRARLQQLGAEAQFSPSALKSPSDAGAPQPNESKEAYAERTLDAMEKRAEREREPLSRDIAFAKAAAATVAEQYERGYKLADRIRDEALRNGVKNWLTFRASLYFAQSNELDRAYQLGMKNEDPAQRASSLIEIAQRFIKARQQFRAKAILQDVSLLLKKAEPEEIWVSIALGLVITAIELDPWLALDSLADAIKHINEFPRIVLGRGPAPVATNVSGFFATGNAIQPRSYGLASALASFRPDQFESVLAVLQKVNRPEVRGIAIVTLCKRFLTLGQGNPRAKKTVSAKPWSRGPVDLTCNPGLDGGLKFAPQPGIALVWIALPGRRFGHLYMNPFVPEATPDHFWAKAETDHRTPG